VKIRSIAFAAAFFVASFAIAQDNKELGDSKARSLLIHKATYELEGKLYSNSADLEAALRLLKPTKVRVMPDKDSTYERVQIALAAIQRVGGIDIGLSGNEQR
jgi:biopolymer transport protein ExbD